MDTLEKIFGLHAVTAMLQQHPKRVKQLWIGNYRADERMRQLIDLATEQRIPWSAQDKQTLAEWTADGTHQGVVAEVSPSQLWSEEMLHQLLERRTGAPLLLVLDGVTDPHNLGACLRSADAAGAWAVLIPKNNSASLTPTVRKVACGAAEIVPLVGVTNLSRALAQLKKRGLWIVGTSGDAPQVLYQKDCTGPIALIMGAEGKGMRQLTRSHCDFLVKLPMNGSVSSLNVSVATGICLFEIQRQRYF